MGFISTAVDASNLSMISLKELWHPDGRIIVNVLLTNTNSEKYVQFIEAKLDRCNAETHTCLYCTRLISHL